jgi:formylglycine-generating enzyme required for sulfatase activity
MHGGAFLIPLQIGLLTPLSLLAQTPDHAKNGGMEFVRIAPGEFMMGCSTGDNDCTADEKPAHRVQITKAFEIGKYEVTQSQWQAVMGSNPSTIKGDDRPVETVSRDDARDFLAHLTARNDGFRYRLPTEAEWEYAARAGTTAAQPAPLDEIAWYDADSGDESHPVGRKKANAWGLYDMFGNVREWVADLFARDFYANSPVADPTGPQTGQTARANFGRGRARQLPVVRGGAWDNPAGFVRASARYHYYGPTLRLSDIGFRAARDPVN